MENGKKGIYIDKYYEKHHIIPRSEGGSNKKDNLVDLPIRHHHLAHLCLRLHATMLTVRLKVKM